MKDSSTYLIDPERLRIARGLRPAAAVARACGITYQYLWAIEAGKKQPSLPVLGRLCDQYGITLRDLLPEKNLRAVQTLS